MKIPELGIGLTYHPVLDPVIENHGSLIQVLEIEPQTHWIQPDPFSNEYFIDESILSKLSALHFHKLMHGIGFPVGGSRFPDEIEYPLHHVMIRELGVPWMSEHLSFNKASFNGKEYVTNYMLPPLQTKEGIETAVSTIREMQSHLPIPIAVETGVNYLRTIPSHINDGNFIRQVVEKADCGILLDLHNIYTNQTNGNRQTMQQFLEEIPLDRVIELHVAGGRMRGDYYIDSHSGKIPEDLFETAKKLIPNLPNLGAIIFEIFPDYLNDIGNQQVQKDLEHLNRIWENRKKKHHRPHTLQTKVAPTNSEVSSHPLNAISPSEWEDHLAALVTRQIQSSSYEEMQNDPAIELIRDLIESFRASMVSESFRYSARLLMIYLGISEYEQLLHDYWKISTPEPFASTEGANFISYIQSRGITCTGLNETIEFEKAYLATLVDGKERTINFSFDPLSFLKAMGEGRKPEKLYEGDYEFVVEGGTGIATKNFHHKAVSH
jgi:uncharacterized protein (UPF0276 family)